MKKILLKKEREDKKKLEESKVENGKNFVTKEFTENLDRTETYPNTNKTLNDVNYDKKILQNLIEIKNHNDSKQYSDNYVNFSNSFVPNHCLYPKSYFSQISYSKEIFPDSKYFTSHEIIDFSDKNKPLDNGYTNKINNQISKKDHKSINNNKNFTYPYDSTNNKDAWIQSLAQSNGHSLSYMLGKRGPNSPLQVPITPTSHNLHNFHSQSLYLSPSGHYLFSIPQQLSKTDHHEEKKINGKNDVFQFNQMSSFLHQHHLQQVMPPKNYNKDNRSYLQEFNHNRIHQNMVYNHMEMSPKNGNIEEKKSQQNTNGNSNSYKSNDLNTNGNTLKSIVNHGKHNKDHLKEIQDHGLAVKDGLSKSYDIKSILNKESGIRLVQPSSSILPVVPSTITNNHKLADVTHHNSSQSHNAINKNYCVKEEKLENKTDNGFYNTDQKQLQKDVKNESTQDNYDIEHTNIKVRSKGRPTKNTTAPNGASLGKPIIKCLVCSKVFNNSSALAKHKLTHSDERRYTCNLCSKAFKRQDHLNGHMMTHSSKKPFECKFAHCFKSYCDARSLKRHLQNYHQASIKSDDVTLETGGESKMADVWAPGFNPLDEPKPIKCLVCGRGFRNIAALNGHMRLHGGYINREPLENKVSEKISSEDSVDSSKHMEDKSQAFNNIPKHENITTQQIQVNEVESNNSIQKIMNFKNGNDGKKELSIQSLRINDVPEQKLPQTNTSNLFGNKTFDINVQNFGNVKNTPKEVKENRRDEQNNSTINSSFKESLLYMRRLRKNSEKSSSRSNTSRRSSFEDNTSGKQLEKFRVSNEADGSNDEYPDVPHYSVHKNTSLQAWVDSVPAVQTDKPIKNDYSMKNVTKKNEENFSSMKSYAHNLSSSNDALSKLDINNDESSNNIFKSDFQLSSNQINGLNVSKTKHACLQYNEQVNVFNKPNEKAELRRGSPSLPSTPFTAHTPYTPRTCGPQSPSEANHFEFPCVPSQDFSQAAIPSSSQCARDPQARSDKASNRTDFIPVLSPQSGAKCAFVPSHADSHKYYQTFPRQKSNIQQSRNKAAIDNNVPYTPPPILSPVINRASFCDGHDKIHDKNVIETNPTGDDKKPPVEHKPPNKNSKSTLPHVNIGALHQAVLPLYYGESSQNALKKSQPLENVTEAVWSGGEVALFEEAMKTHGKNFAMVSQKVITKNTSECILFYYTWKKKSAENYRAFKSIHSSKRYKLRCGR